MIGSIRATGAVLKADKRGSAAIEFAIAGPIFLLVVFGCIQFGRASLARSGLEQAVESGARYATLYPRPSDRAIKDKAIAKGYGLDPTMIVGPNIAYGTNNGMPYAEISMTYKFNLNVPFYTKQTINLFYKRRAYLNPH